jgi:hypothetical protein
MNANAQQTDILASIMTGLAGIRKIPDFTPKNSDLVELADAVKEIKAAAAKWPGTANAAVAAAFVDAYNAATAYKVLSKYATAQSFAVTPSTTIYYNAYIRQVATYIMTAETSCDTAVKATGGVLDPMMAALGQLNGAATAIETEEKALQQQIQTLQQTIASSQAQIAKAKQTKHSWWFGLINAVTFGLADLIFDLVTKVGQLEGQLSSDEQELKQDLDSFNIYMTAAPIAGACAQLVQAVQQWSLGFYNTVGTIKAVLDQVQGGVNSGEDPAFLKIRFKQMDDSADEALAALANLENVQQWARDALMANIEARMALGRMMSGQAA